MTPDQFNALLAAIFDGIAKIGTILIAVFSLWFQSRQESKRNEQAQKREEQEAAKQRDWSVEDRNISRKWLLTDKQIEERKNYLLAHKRFVDDYIANLLILTSFVYMRTLNLEQHIKDDLNASYLQSLEQSTEIYHHVEAFDNTDLRQRIQTLMETVDNLLIPVLREPEKNQDKISSLRGTVAGVTAPVSQLMEKIIAEELRPSDWI